VTWLEELQLAALILNALSGGTLLPLLAAVVGGLLCARAWR
jgi:hypothetical protein